MTLIIHTEEDDRRQLKMTIEVPEERIEKQMRETARKLAKDINLPGFRRGKAPYSVVVNRIGRDTLRAEAIDDMLQSIFEEALDEVKPDIYAQAQFDDMEMEPLVLKFTIPLTPAVTLGDYRSLRKEIEPVNISDEAVAQALKQIRARYQELEEVDRPAAEGDMIVISGRGELIVEVDEDEDEDEGGMEAEEMDTAVPHPPTAAAETDEHQEIGDDEFDEDEYEDEDFDEDEYEDEDDDDDVLFDSSRLEIPLDNAEIFPGTPFVENLVGLSVGESKDFTFVFPEDYEQEDMAGKEAMFSVEVLEVKSRHLPELDDELAQKEGHETLAELEETTRNRLQEMAESQANSDLVDSMVHEMLDISTLVYPPAAVEMEIDGRIQSFKNQVTRSGWQWDDYMKMNATSEQAMREDFREAAEEAVRHQLVLRQFVLNEKLKIKDEDVEAKIEERVAAFKDNDMLMNSMREYYKNGSGFDMLSGEILMDKVTERMVAIYNGSAPSLEELEAEETAVADELPPADETTEATDRAVAEETVEAVESETVEAEPETAVANTDAE
ncbi:MAG: trigger factor [Anaerolineae bacterium]|nr:trigger factor [Anaerolineae bacterium]